MDEMIAHTQQNTFFIPTLIVLLWLHLGTGSAYRDCATPGK
jgi:hypothetical protein